MPESTAEHRIGIYGGTFDPIHLGHLLVAETAREFLGLDEVRFIPAATSPFKTETPGIDGKHRIEMVKLATGGHPQFLVDPRELERGSVSYTVDTLEELRVEFPQCQLLLLMGSDSIEEFDRWKSPNRICELAHIAVLARGGLPEPNLDKLMPYLGNASSPNDHLVKMPELEISSSDLRRRIASGRSIRYQVPSAVEAYISTHQLYT